MKKFLFGIIAVAGSTLFTLLLLELLLHFFPVRSYISFAPVTREDPVLHFQPNGEQTYAAGWDFDAYNQSKINAQGYIADFDFVAQDDKPLIAVVGDSYIEARMVPFAETVQERLHQKLASTHRVYGIGIGGSPLSQYLAFAAKMRDEYRPGFMVVNIVANDFDESLPQYKNMSRFHYFVPDENGKLEPQLIGDYIPSSLKELVSHSALVRYLYFHLNLADTVNDILFRHRSKNTDAGPAAPSDNQHVTDSQQAVDAFLALLPRYSGLPKNRLLLVIDGQRPDIYAGTPPSDDYFGKMRSYTLTQARLNGYEIIDMHPAFAADYAAHGQLFDFRRDGHWNARAHGVAAQEILKSRNLQGYLKQ